MTIVEQAEHIRLAAREELSRCRAVLERVGLTSSEPELVPLSRGVDEYTAELKVEFYQNENIVDLFEFFVCREGILTTSEDEVRQWIRDNVPDVIARRT